MSRATATVRSLRRILSRMHERTVTAPEKAHFTSLALVRFTCPQTPSSRSAAAHSHPTSSASNSSANPRFLTTTARLHKGLRPETSDPAPPNPEAQTTASAADEPTPLDNETYHELSDDYLDRLVSALEEKAEANAEYDVEYSAGVLKCETPQGTWVINKQPPNKQIWLSSPLSGPKRYDYQAPGAGQDAKEGTDAASLSVDVEGKITDYDHGGRWVYLRDGSGLSELLKNELELDVPKSLDG
ncbi:Frataxin-like protein [Cyphellophora attinorum]|uniref:ferroxidase n=1 Tax=Cyphellophora attinorum TaxID=1664694 RepID=A0A0N0NNT2_9EURO|nr:Frataxin-like protein [Phialophora attinorum]KPI41951.1 Frataxin-like protein [Phialophora attinorum]